MFDTHHDLLSIAYKAYLTGDYSYLKKMSDDINENNVKGVIANLYFMKPDEMSFELCEDYYKENVSVLDMFIKAKEVLDTYIPDVDFIYSIEGADYIKNEDELEALYNAGLDALILCWNNENKYGSGNRSDKGLTKEGAKLINKAIDLGMGIDLSHANKNTFYDLCDLIQYRKNKGDDVCCYASHSNSRALCDRDRNLDDSQLKRIKDINGLVGVFALKNFTILPDDDNKNYKDVFLRHIEHIKKIVGDFNVMVASDNMDFCLDRDESYFESSIYNYSNISKKLYKDLERKFGYVQAYFILYENAKDKIFDKLKTNRYNNRIGDVK